MNINAPVRAATANAPQVILRSSDDIRTNGLWREATPNSRRSTIRIVPNTTLSAMTWTDSNRGNRYSESRMPLARAVPSRLFSHGEISTVLSGLGCGREVTPDVIVGDEPAEKNDTTQHEKDQQRREAHRAAPYQRLLPLLGVSSHRDLESRRERGQHSHEHHLQPERQGDELAHGLGDDQEATAGK